MTALGTVRIRGVGVFAGLALLAACSGASESKPAIRVGNQLCDSAAPYTALDVGDYRVKILEPNDLQRPDIWQGPICVTNKINNVECGFDLSLVKRVAPAADGNALDVAVFSGSNARTVRITLATCKMTDPVP